MIKAIIFDCFGVLTTDAWLKFTDGLSGHDEVKQARELSHQYDASLLSYTEFIEKVVELTGHPAEEIEKILDGSESSQNKNSRLLNYIRRLRKQGYKIGLLSNISNNWIREEFLNPEEQRLFDVMVFSYEVGVTKPNPRMYQEITKRLNVLPKDAVFIDDVEAYAFAAQEVGMQAVIYHNLQQVKAELEKILERG